MEMVMLVVIFLGLGTAWILGVGLLCLFLRQRLQKRKRLQNQTEDRISIGLFHPYCNGGSGGERVLWVALKCLQIRYPSSQFILYTGDSDASPEEILAKAKERFNIILPSPVDFVYLHKRKWVEAKRYPYFTLLGTSIGSVYMGLEALSKFVPDVYIDTMGYTFTLPLFKYLGNCRVGCFMHSPVITTDMLHRVTMRYDYSGYGTRVAVSSFTPQAVIRLVFNKVFAKVYGWAGRSSDIVMVNSSWTEEHINQIWQCSSKTYKVFPPCDVEGFKSVEKRKSVGSEEEANGHKSSGNVKEETGMIKIVSVGQFRPEKDHPLQIRTLYQLREILREEDWNRICLVMIGSCRHKEDAARVKDMEDLCKHLSVEGNVQFRVNISHDELRAELADGLIGIHTMWNEQFGMGIVESMASGLIVVANRSGGPMMDVVLEYDGSRNGFLATDENDYAEAIRNIIHMTPECQLMIRNQARASVERFSERQFTKSFLEAVQVSLFR